jgi:hypothetical protein
MGFIIGAEWAGYVTHLVFLIYDAVLNLTDADVLFLFVYSLGDFFFLFDFFS